MQQGIGKKESFTSLFRQLSPAMLRMAFLALKWDAAPGVDGLAWQGYEADLELRIKDLHKRAMEERTVHCHPGGDIRSRMAANARLRSQLCVRIPSSSKAVRQA